MSKINCLNCLICFGVNGWPKFKDNNEYGYTLVHSKLNGAEELFGKSHRSCKRKFNLRCINNATKFGEKNPTENGKFLSVIFVGFLV